MADYRVTVVRRHSDDGEPPWVAYLEVDRGAADPIPVGRFATHPEAIMRGCTALRFVSVGIPWREGAGAR